MNNIIFNTELIKGAKGDTGDTGLSYEVPTGAIIAYDGQGIPEGYVETTEPLPPVPPTNPTYADGLIYHNVGDIGLAGYTKVTFPEPALQNATAVTFEVCAKIDDFIVLTQDWPARIIEFGDSQQHDRLGSFALIPNNGVNELEFWDTTVDLMSGLLQWTLGDTHTLSVVKTTSGVLKIYIDGVLTYTGTSSLSPNQNMIDYITIRSSYADQVGQKQTDGDIYDWRIYARELTDAEILNNYTVDVTNYV